MHLSLWEGPPQSPLTDRSNYSTNEEAERGMSIAFLDLTDEGF